VGNTLIFILGVILQVWILVVPSRIPAQFDGLPWGFLSFRFFVLSLGALLFLKFILFVAKPCWWLFGKSLSQVNAGAIV
jgi:hypothetical protein